MERAPCYQKAIVQPGWLQNLSKRTMERDAPGSRKRLASSTVANKTVVFLDGLIRSQARPMVAFQDQEVPIRARGQPEPNSKEDMVLAADC